MTFLSSFFMTVVLAIGLPMTVILFFLPAVTWSLIGPWSLVFLPLACAAFSATMVLGDLAADM